MLRIAITGPESTGKSELANQLSTHYRTIFVPEIAREYIDSLGKSYVYNDIVKIAKKQMAMENLMARQAENILFCDTDPLVTKIWSIYKYGKCDQWIEEKVISHRYHLYLLCDIDLPWEEDPLREHPDKRKDLFEMYFMELEGLKVNYKVISGLGDIRLMNAILAVEEALKRVGSRQ